MAKVFCLVNQKGGCAKTQSTMQIAGELAVRGNKVAVIDMDPQGTAVTWNSQSPDETPFPATVFSLSAVGSKIFSEIRKHSPNFDYILIDCPPAIDSEVPWHVLLASQLAIVPVLPDMGNIWASKKAIDLTELAKRHNHSLKVKVLAARVPRGKAYQVCLEELRDNAAISMFETQLADRVAYPESQIFGSCISITSPKSAAGKEVSKLVDEILIELGH
ncbi:chromosome partitioning protein [Undibacterium sp. GrIS 1.8]|uniref:ParA family protein n=1 Tax=unclassified Undibacterium TaxID=2630295 RepID=UPI003393CF91